MPGILLATAAVGEQADCERLPAERQPACWMLQACAGIDDGERRRECFDAAAQRFLDGAETAVAAPAQAVTADVASDEIPPPEPDAGTLEAADATNNATVEPGSPRAAHTAETAASIAVDPPPAPPSESAPTAIPLIASPAVLQPAPDLPRRFSATVTAVRRLARDRQLVALDDKLLFQGERASIGRMAVGDSVRVIRASSVFGRRFRITGPSRRPFDAVRIRCEHPDLSAANRRKCAAMLHQRGDGGMPSGS